jgi:cupin fold WbuC family metalloprotein
MTEAHAGGGATSAVDLDGADIERLKAGADHGEVRFVTDREGGLEETFVCAPADGDPPPTSRGGSDESLHVIEGEVDVTFFDNSGDVERAVTIGAYGSDRPFYCRLPGSRSHAWRARSGEAIVRRTSAGAGAPARKARALSAQGPGVYVAGEDAVALSREDCAFLIAEAPTTEKGRTRICTHRDAGDALQEMFIALADGSYLRPSVHRRDESIHVLEGRAAYLFFDEAGEVTEILQLGAFGSADRSFYCRIPKGTYHALVVQSDTLLVHEATEGPFDPGDTAFAVWAPEESDTAGADAYMRRLEALANAELSAAR